MRTDVKAFGGLMIPEIAVPKVVRNVDPSKREWYFAGFFSLLWVAGLGTYGMGYFSRVASSGRGASVLEVAIFVATLLMPVMCLWAGAFVLNWSRRVDTQTAELIEAVEELQGALAMASPATADKVIESVSEAAKSAVKAEHNRMNSALRIIGEDQRHMGEAVRLLLKSRQTEQSAMAELVQTAQAVTSEAAEAAEAADAARATALSGLFGTSEQNMAQDALPFGDASAAEANRSASELRWSDINRALNFPADATDKAAFAAIRSVMPNRTMAQLLHKSEAVLALLAEEGIYMDDLDGVPANPEDWRAFAKGTRGKELDGLGAVRDSAAIALAKGRIRTDTGFQEGVLGFLREFDDFLREFVDHATTKDLIGLGTTRTGRAFQLLARATGAFS